MLVTRVWPGQRPGGMAFVCQDRANELVRQGHDVHVLTTSCSKNEGDVLEAVTRHEEGARVVYTQTPAHKWSWPFADSCRLMVEHLAPDILHLESFDRENVWWPGVAPKVVVTMHGLGWGGWLTKWNKARAFGDELPTFPLTEIMAEIRGLEQADVVMGVSKWEYRLLRDQYGLEQARLMYNPIAPYFFELEKPPKKNRKGFLCAAVSQGGTRGFKIAQLAAKKAGVELHIAAAVARHLMPGFYDRVEAVVLPTSFCQGYDLTIAEARARGIPAIMTPTGSYLDEAIPWWDTLVPIGDELALANVLENYQGGLRSIEHEYNPSHKPAEHVRRWLEAIEEAAPRKRAAPASKRVNVGVHHGRPSQRKG